MICQDKGIFHYQLFDKSVNTEKYIEFLNNLKKKHGKKPMAIYADNLMVHKCKDSMDECQKLDIKMIWAPAYSPELNPIEYVFSKLKNAARKMRLNDMMKKQQRSFRDIVPLAVDQVTV